MSKYTITTTEKLRMQAFDMALKSCLPDYDLKLNAQIKQVLDAAETIYLYIVKED